MISEKIEKIFYMKYNCNVENNRNRIIIACFTPIFHLYNLSTYVQNEMFTCYIRQLFYISPEFFIIHLADTSMVTSLHGETHHILLGSTSMEYTLARLRIRVVKKPGGNLI